jgi:ketosteroid isomerase-like protein
MAHPNEELLRRGYEAFSKGDLDTVLGIFDENIVWHVPGRNPIAGDYKGHAEVTAFFGKIFELSGGTFKLEIHDVLANDEHVVVMTHATGQRESKRLDSTEVNVWHVKNGKATEFWAAPLDAYADDEFWS